MTADAYAARVVAGDSSFSWSGLEAAAFEGGGPDHAVHAAPAHLPLLPGAVPSARGDGRLPAVDVVPGIVLSMLLVVGQLPGIVTGAVAVLSLLSLVYVGARVALVLRVRRRTTAIWSARYNISLVNLGVAVCTAVMVSLLLRDEISFGWWWVTGILVLSALASFASFRVMHGALRAGVPLDHPLPDEVEGVRTAVRTMTPVQQAGIRADFDSALTRLVDGGVVELAVADDARRAPLGGLVRWAWGYEHGARR